MGIGNTLTMDDWNAHECCTGKILSIVTSSVEPAFIHDV